MITKAEYNKIYNEWLTVSDKKRVYQEWYRIADRIEHFDSLIDCLKDKDVIEIGRNAGIHAWHICKVAKSYVGYDPGEYYHKQAKITKKHIEEFNKNVEFVRGTVKAYLKDPKPVNAWVSSFALYHFPDDEVKLIRDELLPKLDTVMIANRCQYRPTAHNSYKFWKTKRIVKWLEPAGFKCEVHDSKQTHQEKGYKGPKWQILIGRKVTAGVKECDNITKADLSNLPRAKVVVCGEDENIEFGTGTGMETTTGN